MLSIGITVCDTDYHLLNNLLKQIKERVKVEHEVIIIDNREQFLDVVTDWEADFTFGYNATQFAARAKIIELSNDDYIWFIDGDDEIDFITDINYTEDIIVFSYSSYPVGDVHIHSKIIKDNILSYETSCYIQPVLWNKFIKKTCFKEKFNELKIITNEDVLWCYSALKNAKSVRCIDKIIYHHKLGLSNKEDGVTLNDIKTLVTGYNDMRKLLYQLVGEDFFKRSIKATNGHIMSFIPRTKDVVDATVLFLDLIPEKEFKDSLFEIYSKCKNKNDYQSIVNTINNRYGENSAYPIITKKVLYADGRTENYTFFQKIEF